MRALVVTLLVAGCTAAPVPTPAPPEPCRNVNCVTEPPLKNKVDVLFVLDDGPTMGPKLDAVRAAVPGFIATLDDAAQIGQRVWYHLGVVTADLGAGAQPNAALGCRPGGDGAVVRFFDYDQLGDNANASDATAALTALADVGTAGCDFRHPLEAAYRALHDQISANIGFLRSDALLAVVFVSDTDDCSAPAATDLFDASATQYGPLTRFRCTQFGVQCNGQPVPPMAISGLTGCSSYDVSNGGELTDIGTYIDFFTKPAAQGGVKVDPGDVVLVGIDGPRDPVGVSIASPCADASAASCATLQHSCIAPDDLQRFGDPAVRLDLVVSSARHFELSSICDADDEQPLRALVSTVTARASRDCLNAPVAARADGTPDCVAVDVTANPDGSTTTRAVPSCAENGHVTPCWELVDRLPQYDGEGCAAVPSPSTCKLPPSCQPVVDPTDGVRELYTVDVDRTGTPLPSPGTTTQISCATIP